MSDPGPPPLVFTAEPPSDRGWHPSAALVVCLGLLGLAAVAVALFIVVPGGSAKPKSAARRGSVATRGQAVRTITRLILTPTGSDQNAFGAAAIVRPAHGGMLLLLNGQGLPVSQTDSSALWLFNAPGDAHLLGFISPNAGSAGTFSSVTPLPDDAGRFHELIVTLETTSRPALPGRAVLKAPLGLSASGGGRRRAAGAP